MKTYFILSLLLTTSLVGARVARAFTVPKAVVDQINIKIAGNFNSLPDYQSMPKAELLHEGYMVREAVGDDWKITGYGDYFGDSWQLGLSNLVEADQLSQLQIDLNNVPRLRYLFFEYQVLSADENLDFNQPILQVYVNNKLVFVANHGQDRGKKMGIIDLSQFESELLDCRFVVASKSSDWVGTVVMVKNLTTRSIIANDQATLSLLIDGRPATNEESMFLWGENRLGYFVTNKAGLSSELAYVPYYTDESQPSVQVIQTYVDELKDESYFLLKLEDNFVLKSWKILGASNFVALSDDSGLSIGEYTALSDDRLWFGIKKIEDTAKIELTDFAGNKQIVDLK